MELFVEFVEMAKKVKTSKKKKTKKPSVAELAKKATSEVHLPPITSIRTATLQAAVITEDLTSLQRLVVHYDYDKDLTTVDINGSTLLHIAVKKEDNAMLERLLSFQRINLNALEASAIGGSSALHLACQSNQRRAVDLLLRAGANPNIKCNSSIGETPLMICCKLGHLDCARILLTAGASVSTVDNFGNNASFWAYKYQHDILIRELNLPPVHTPTAEEYLQLLLQRNPRFTLPTLKKTKKKSAGKKKKK